MRAMTLAAVLALTAALTGCGGSGEDCRSDFVGPPSPGFEDLPVCTVDGRAAIPVPTCNTHPERCA